jgi:hypothetical protein
MEPYRLGTGGCRNLSDQELHSIHNQISLGSNQGAENVLLMTFVMSLPKSMPGCDAAWRYLCL